MKNKYIVATLIALMAFGVGCSKDTASTIDAETENPVSGNPIENILPEEVESKVVLLENAKAEGNSLFYSIKNGHEKGALSYSNPYVILMLRDDERWEFTDFTNEMSFTAEMNFVEPLTSGEEETGIKFILDKLEAGKTYRVAKNLGVEGVDFLYEARIDFKIKEDKSIEVIKAFVIELPAPELPEDYEVPAPVEDEQVPSVEPETPLEGDEASIEGEDPVDGEEAPVESEDNNN